MLETASDKCCGCGACALACPKKCISMVADYEGFLYPNVATDLCVNCNFCNLACPCNAEMKNDRILKHAYLAYNLNATKREKASSGGVFIELASEILKNSGVVYGVVCAEDLSAKHARAEKLEQVYPMLGSKYVQSVVGDSFELVSHDIKNGKTVLYSGTPCQIAGLLSYLEVKKIDASNNLITVDTLCHGVPSQKVLSAYVSQYEKKCGETVKRISFRDKRTGWQNYSIVLSTENHEYSCDANSDTYMLAFRKNLSLRRSCYSCPFKLGKHYVFADITLGDFWGVGREFKQFESDDKGISWITVHTNKGQSLMDAISKELYLSEVDIEIPLRNNTSATYPAVFKSSRSKFFAGLDRGINFNEWVLKMAGETGVEGMLRKIKRWAKKKISSR